MAECCNANQEEIRPVTMSERELDELVDRAISRTLERIGIDTSDPFELQADARFIRKLRRTHERVGNKIIVTIVGVTVAGILAAVCTGIVTMIHDKGGG